MVAGLLEMPMIYWPEFECEAREGQLFIWLLQLLDSLCDYLMTLNMCVLCICQL